MRKKLWFRIFMRIAAIFAGFVLILTVSNRIFLVRFFETTEKNYLVEQGKAIKALDFDNSGEVLEALSKMGERYNFEAEIYTLNGKVLYTSYGSQMMDFYYNGNPTFSMNHKKLKVVESEKRADNSVIERAVDTHTDTEYLIYRLSLSEGLNAELRVQTSLLQNSADVANRFITVVAAVCLVLALIWTMLSVKRFSTPITQMSCITRDMADLKFERTVSITSDDEIGELARSINEMSQKLSTTLEDLRRSNAKLRDEIELERRLDVMRKGFVANVSHELKTPISIIRGYAEGLKLNINSESREGYCDTIIDESERMNRLVLGLLQLSKYESGQAPLNREPFSLLETARDMCGRIFKDSDVSVILPDSDVIVFDDKLQVEQLYKSILENARAHVNASGRVEVRFLPDGEKTAVQIFNTGSHIAPEQMPQIWQSFYRGEKSHKREQTRFGLGLSIVSAVSRMRGEKCGVFNTDSGICFWFTVQNEKKAN